MSVAPLTVSAQPAVGALLDQAIEAVGEPRAERWRIDRTGYRPELVAAHAGDGTLVGVALTTGRPATAATKIVDVWAADAGAAASVIDAVVARARLRDDAVVKWELAPGLSLPSAAVGFAPMREPWAAVGTEDVRGFARWLIEVPHVEPGYYAQTTMFTCGAVAALIAADAGGVSGFGGAGDRDLELEFWRRASNFPACEPVGLAVALAERVGSGVEVALDHDGPVLLESYDGFDRAFRAELQAESVRRAGELGVPLRRDRVGVDEIARRVGAGERALLLIDEEPMHGEHGPHWIVAHAAAGDLVLVQEPWINRATGETWVDAHDLPIRLADLERLVTWSESGYRGVVFAG
ncbi:peptidase C39 family protein [Microbacterium fluvii]|uniref:Peptidase C39 family protein n=1 Tax=Microbacterium fluvii TaxID=415215 RepID=A0ABW2HD23_9MICO|nr:peptidase C39 family protein [Microbacterium fluvii]MCU4671281.1 peptidase C39 family protein [Microbacterium fluvii]